MKETANSLTREAATRSLVNSWKLACAALGVAAVLLFVTGCAALQRTINPDTGVRQPSKVESYLATTSGVIQTLPPNPWTGIATGLVSLAAAAAAAYGATHSRANGKKLEAISNAAPPTPK